MRLSNIQAVAVEFEDEVAQQVAIVKLNAAREEIRLPMARLNPRRWIRVLFLSPPGCDYYLEIDGVCSPKLFQCRFKRPVRGLLVLRHRKAGAELSLQSELAPRRQRKTPPRTPPKQLSRS